MSKWIKEALSAFPLPFLRHLEGGDAAQGGAINPHPSPHSNDAEVDAPGLRDEHADNGEDSPETAPIPQDDEPAVVFDISSASERGGRMRNEDSSFFTRSIACVSDGIGGAPYGDVLSQICAHAFLDEWAASCEDGEARMASAIIGVDNLASRVSAYLEGGSGSTLVAAAQAQEHLLVLGSVGDSAAFVLSPEGTFDAYFGPRGRHSQTGNAMNVALGYHLLSDETGHAIPGTIDFASVPVPAGTKVLLCTDGVWSQLPQERIVELLKACSDPYEAACRIVREAVEARGESSDNATALVIMARERDVDQGSKEPFALLDDLLERTPARS